MNKEAIVQKLIESAEILDAQGLHREADVIHEGIRTANQADAWGNFMSGLGEVAQWINPMTAAGKVWDTVSPAFKGLHDNTGRYQQALNQFNLDLQNSSIDSRAKYYLLELMQQALVSAQKMNPEYYENNFGTMSAPTASAAPTAAPTKQRSRDELMKSLSSSKFNRVIIAQEVQADTATSLFNKLNQIQSEWVGSIRSDTPGYKETVQRINAIKNALQKLSVQEQSSNQSPQINPNEVMQQMQAASSDPQVQQAIKAYLRYGLKYGPEKMLASLEANAQNQDITAFRALLKSSWTSELQNAWNAYYAKMNPAKAPIAPAPAPSVVPPPSGGTTPNINKMV